LRLRTYAAVHAKNGALPPLPRKVKSRGRIVSGSICAHPHCSRRELFLLPNSITNVRYVRPALRGPFDYRLTEPCDSITWRHRPRSGERGVSRDRYLGRPGVRPRLAPFTSPGSHSDSRPVSRGGVHVAMRTESCTGKRVFAARRGVALNAASGPGYAAFVARSLSVKLNSRGDSTRRYTSLAPPALPPVPPGACSPLVSLYAPTGQKRRCQGREEGEGSRPAATTAATGMSLLRPSAVSSPRQPGLSSPPPASIPLSCSFTLRPDARRNLLIPRSQFRRGFVPPGRSRLSAMVASIRREARYSAPLARDNVDQEIPRETRLRLGCDPRDRIRQAWRLPGSSFERGRGFSPFRSRFAREFTSGSR